MMQNELSGVRVFAWLGVIAGSLLGLARADDLVDHSIRVGFNAGRQRPERRLHERSPPQFFKAISGLVRLSRVGPDGHRIVSVTVTVTVAAGGKSARIQTQIRLGGKWQPPGTEVWTLVDGTWCYPETVKK